MTEVVEVEGSPKSYGRSSWCVLPKKHDASEVAPSNFTSSFTKLRPNADKTDRTPQKCYSNARNEDELNRRRGCASPDSVMDVLAFIPTADGTGDDDDDSDDDSCSQFQDTISRAVRFADEEGKPLTEVRLIKNEKGLLSRVVVLLMSPSERIFEFLHAEYPRDETTTVEVLLEQLPKICSNPVFRFKTFVELSRTKNQELLENEWTMQSCNLDEGELLLAVLDGYNVNKMASFALPLLLNGRIQKAVKHAKRTGRGLKTVRSGEDWRQQMSSESSQSDETQPQKPGATQELQIAVANCESPEARSDSSSKSSETDALLKRVDEPNSAVDIVESVPNLVLDTENIGKQIQKNPRFLVSQVPDLVESPSNSSEDCDFSDFPMPDIDSDNSKWRLPEIGDYIGGEEAKEKVIFFIHAVSVASAAGLLLSWA